MNLERCSKVEDAGRRLLTALLQEAPGSPLLQEDLGLLGIPWLVDQGLASLARVRFYQEGFLSDECRNSLRTIHWKALVNAELLRRQLERLLKALNESGIVPTPVKGASLAFTVYPQPACRPMGDIDLWIRPDQMPTAKAVLLEIGYLPCKKQETSLEYLEEYCGEAQFSPKSPAGHEIFLVELHSKLFPGEWLRYAGRTDEEAIRRRMTLSRLGECSIYRLDPEDELLHVAAHMAINHQMSGPWLRPLADIVLIVRNRPLHWDALISRAIDWRLAGAVGLVLRLAADLAGLQEARQAARALAPPFWRRKAVERMLPARFLVEMGSFQSGPWRYLFQLLLVDRWPDAIHMLWRTFWPERRWLMARYDSSSCKGLRKQYWLRVLQGKI